jgi:3-oxoacyl-[acyl-carrier-protein] synthase II
MGAHPASLHRRPAVSRPRVVVTGLGIVSPVGTGHQAFWEGLLAAKSGVRPIRTFDASTYPTRFAADVPDFDPAQYLDRKDIRHMDRFAQLGVAAAQLAWDDAGFSAGEPDPERSGVLMGTGIGGMDTLVSQLKVLEARGPARVSPFFIPMMIGNMLAGHCAIRFNLRGPNVSTTTACASSGHALGDALRAIQYGEADVMLSGGAEAVLLPIALAGFSSMRALSTNNEDYAHASRPFDRDRDGFVMGEGAGVVVLESWEHAAARGAHIYAELAGYGRSADAYHIVEPHPDGDGAAAAMRAALADAGLHPEDIGYINAHGTSTPLGDLAETKAIKRVFGEHAYKLAVSSTKSVTGHLFGAAGAVEAIATTLALYRQVLPPTANLEHPDDECDLDYVPLTARPASVRAALTNAFGFGGHNASLALTTWAEASLSE